MTPELSAKISNYVITHGLSFSPQRVVLSAMLKDGVITRAEYNEAMRGNIFALSDIPLQNVGDDVVITTPLAPVETNVNRGARHPVYDFLRLDSSGKIDMSQFSIESIKAKYPESDYELKEQKTDSNIVIQLVFNKQTGKLVYSQMINQFETGYTEYFISFINNGGDSTGGISVADGHIVERVDMNEDGSSNSYSYLNGDISKISEKFETKADGSRTVLKYRNSRLASKINFDKDNQFIDGYVYSDGKIYAECNEYENITRNYIVDSIKDCIYGDDPNKIEKLKKIINEKVTKSTIEDVLENYYDETGSLLVDDLARIAGITPQEFSDIYSVISAKMHEVLETEPDVADLRKRLLCNFRSDMAEEFKEAVFLIIPDNAYEVQSAFGDDDSQSDIFGLESFDTLLNMVNNLNMSDEDKAKCRKHLVDTLIKSYENRGLFVEDIKKDILSHLNDPKKFDVDYRRLVSRGSSDPSDEKISEPNGEIDLDIIQGAIGDCWLIAGLKNLGHKKSGKEFLKNMLSVDKENKTVTVTFPAVSKSYTITFDEINKSNHLAKGDGDARAIEIAVDRYIKEYAYSGTDLLTDDLMKSSHKDLVATTMMLDDTDDYALTDRYDLNADNTQFFYKLLFGDSESVFDADMEKSDFNDDNSLFTFSITEENAVMAYDKEENDYIYIDSSHAYIVDHSDAKYIYLIDPRNEGYTPLRVKRAALKKIAVEIETTRISGGG